MNELEPSTIFFLMAEFKTGVVPLADVSVKYLSMDPKTAKRKAALDALPFPTLRVGSQKAEPMVSIADLARAIDKAAEAGREKWKLMNE